MHRLACGSRGILSHLCVCFNARVKLDLANIMDAFTCADDNRWSQWRQIGQHAEDSARMMNVEYGIECNPINDIIDQSR